MSEGWPGAIGVVGHGVSEPSRVRMRPDLCAEQGHPGVTYNPWVDRTWCLCGEVIREGNQHTHAACCGGPLIEHLSEADRVFWARNRLSAPDISTFEVPVAQAGDMVLF